MNAGHREKTHPVPTGSAGRKLRRSNWRPPGRRALLSSVTADAMVCRCLQGLVLTVLCASVGAEEPAPAPTPVPGTPAAAPATATPIAVSPASAVPGSGAAAGEPAPAPGTATSAQELPSPAEQLEEVIVQ